MQPAAISVIVKSDRIPKRFPREGEMVRMTDRKGLFRVKRVDRQQHVADLVYRSRAQVELEENVPFGLIRSVPRETSRFIEEFLHSESGPNPVVLDPSPGEQSSLQKPGPSSLCSSA